MPTIDRISVKLYDVPLKGTLKWGKGHELPHLAHVLIKVELSDSSIGIAEATPRPSIYGETQTSTLHIIEHHLSPLLVGQTVTDFDSVAKLITRMELIKGNNTAKGALDMALHHALSQSQGMTLGDYLGVTQDKIPVSYIVSTGATEAVITDVESAHRVGVRVFKVKIGKDIPQETDTIRQLTTQFPDAQFYVDANQTLSVTDGAEVLNTLYAMGVIHCEEALPIYQIKERNLLRHQTRMPIIADDSAFTFHDLQREVAFDTFDILNIKTPRTGFSISKQMLQFATAHHKTIMIGSQASSLLGCLYASLFSGLSGIDHANECSFFIKTDVDLSDAPLIKDGYLHLNEVQRSLDGLVTGLI